ncbi:bifunctional 2-keto-4-hydroxyglutarate aldolase/2-keto-3-deoxy-6-phosphogluconate aldolase, partial [Fusobacterium mortiferum]|nr:bifunctional 2-keto-4-hydroxyglutarate aldolase/2-keto-3-deoxy-6-phosphogluconate aldolase [Fusobacterium mortiferum]MBM6876541.1 bifunctional 2-keto-4-hydroxyglutarate aldolase/2-keto-3-deoxy-6-phosphogluconate aldolase [Fusobacterium mortiferum]
MLKKGKILERLADIGIVAVVRGESVAEGVRISKACA